MPETFVSTGAKPHESRPIRRDSRFWFFVALALTFLLRLWFVLGMRGQPFSTIGPQMLDSWYYHRWAVDIISGNFWGSDVFFLRPLYPYLLALVYAVLGQHVLAVQLVQTAVATISCFLLYKIAGRVFGRRTAIFSSFGFALTGILVFYTGTLLYVETTILLSLLLVWLVLIARKRILLWILMGICFGLLVVCRPELLLLLPFLLIWLWPRRSTERRTPSAERSRLLTMTVAALVVVAAVPLRNYIVARDPVLFTAHSGINFYYGNNPAADGTWQPTAELERGGGFSHERLAETSRTVEGREVKPSQASAYWTALGFRFITRQPGAYLGLLGRKFLLFLSNYEVPNDYYPETARAASLPLKLAFVNFGLVLALGLLGMVWAWPRRGQALPLYLFVAAYLVSALLFYVLSRLRAPLIPFLLMFAAHASSELVDAMRQRRIGRVGVGAAIFVLVYVISAVVPVSRKSYSAQAWTQAGTIHLEQQDFGKAVGEFRRALSAMPSYNYARYSLVLALAGAGNAAGAGAELLKIERATAASDDRTTILRLAAARLAIANAISTADPAWRPARRLADAWAAVADGNYTIAESLYRASLAQDPTDSEASFLLGTLYTRMDSLTSARKWLARAASLDPGNEAAGSALRSIEAQLQPGLP